MRGRYTLSVPRNAKNTGNGLGPLEYVLQIVRIAVFWTTNDCAQPCLSRFRMCIGCQLLYKLQLYC